MGIDLFTLLVILAVAAVIIILALGVGNFGRGGDAKTSNKLMRWRLIAQAGAVVLILVLILVRQMGGE